MAEKRNEIIERVYSAASTEEIQQAYNAWAARYEADIFRYAARFPFVPAAVFTRFVKPGEGPTLDAGCGTGLQIEPIALAGYAPITGIDLSEEMLGVARSKGFYSMLRKMDLGKRLDFQDGEFANAITVGTITPGHAPPGAFRELIRVVRRGGKVVLNLRTDDEVDPACSRALCENEHRGLWKKRFESRPYAAMPVGEPEVLTTVFVYEVL